MMTDEWDFFGHLSPAFRPADQPTEYLEQLRATVASFRAAREGLARAREAGAAFSKILQHLPGAEDPLRELGHVMEALSMAEQLLDKGPR